jgi:hypothetical protein
MFHFGFFLDVDECKDKVACQCPECKCKNTWGSYECSCSGGLLYMREHDTCISEYPLRVSKTCSVNQIINLQLSTCTTYCKDLILKHFSLLILLFNYGTIFHFKLIDLKDVKISLIALYFFSLFCHCIYHTKKCVVKHSLCSIS